MSHDRILILDFGSQVTQLIARRVREAHVYCEVHPNDVSESFIRDFAPKGIILSGSHMSAYDDSNDQVSAAVFEAGVPVLGICYGMQMAVIETMQNVCGVKNAYTTELRPNCEPVVGLMTEWEKDGDKQKRSKDGDLGGTMRLGAYPCVLAKDSLAHKVYGSDKISERHRHRYEVNLQYEKQLNEAGMVVSGRSPDGRLPEIVEIPNHPWFIGVQFHPELKSKPFDPHPLFVSFVKASIEKCRLI